MNFILKENKTYPFISVKNNKTIFINNVVFGMKILIDYKVMQKYFSSIADKSIAIKILDYVWTRMDMAR